MSLILLEIAEPLLSGLDLPYNRVEYENALKVAATLWNARLLPDPARRAQVVAELANLLGQAGDTDVMDQFRAVMERASERYPKLEWMISDVEVVPRPDGNFQINVAALA